MKKTLIAAAAAVLLLGLLTISSGCGDSTAAGSNNLTPEKYNLIEIGMSTDQVKLIAGNPIKKETKSMHAGHSMGNGSMAAGSMTMEYWYYQGNKGWVRLEVADGKVSAKSGY